MKSKTERWSIALIALLVVVALVAGATISGAATRWDWRTRSQIGAGAGSDSGVTKQEVLTMLSQCNPIVNSGFGISCNDRCNKYGKTCVHAEMFRIRDENGQMQLSPRVGLVEYCGSGGDRNIEYKCVCCSP